MIKQRLYIKRLEGQNSRDFDRWVKIPAIWNILFLDFRFNIKYVPIIVLYESEFGISNCNRDTSDSDANRIYKTYIG